MARKYSNKILKSETRKQIYNFILKYRGLRLREVSRKLKIPMSTLNYHLRYLEKYGLIVINSEEIYERFYEIFPHPYHV